MTKERRIAIVTGASRGIGAAIATRMAEAGIAVAAAARTLEPRDGLEGSLRETVEDIVAHGGEAVAIRADLSKPDDQVALVERTETELGPPDILVNNAAVTWFAPVTEFADKRYQLMFDMQVRAPFHLCQLVLPGMRERGRGWILNISSRAATHPSGPPFDDIWRIGNTVYGMCKIALERMTTGLSAEFEGTGVAVNALAPWSIVETRGASSVGLVADDVEPIDLMAEAALALCSGDPTTLTGRIAYSQQFMAELNGTMARDGSTR